jgi:hypothetical protein
VPEHVLDAGEVTVEFVVERAIIAHTDRQDMRPTVSSPLAMRHPHSAEHHFAVTRRFRQQHDEVVAPIDPHGDLFDPIGPGADATVDEDLMPVRFKLPLNHIGKDAILMPSAAVTNEDALGCGGGPFCSSPLCNHARLKLNRLMATSRIK